MNPRDLCSSFFLKIKEVFFISIFYFFLFNKRAKFSLIQFSRETVSNFLKFDIRIVNTFSEGIR